MRLLALSLSIAAGLATQAAAQSTGNISRITHYTVKPDRVGDFQATIKEMNAVMRKANFDKAMTAWVATTGPTVYALVTYHEKWAEFDRPPSGNPKLKEVAPSLAALNARMMQCVEKREATVSEVQTDLSLPRTSEIPKMARVLRTRVRPDRVNEYTALIKSDVLPAAKKAGLKTYQVSRMRFGAPSSEFFSVTGLNGWSELDGKSPLVSAMGDENYQRFVSKLRQLTYESQYNIYRFLPDLSYLPGAVSPTGGN